MQAGNQRFSALWVNPKSFISWWISYPHGIYVLYFLHLVSRQLESWSVYTKDYITLIETAIEKTPIDYKNQILGELKCTLHLYANITQNLIE